MAGDSSADSLLVCITFHYVPARLPTLLDVVWSLADFVVKKLDLVVLTNTEGSTERAQIIELLSPVLTHGKSLEVLSCPDLDHPYDLAWAHKKLIVDRFLSRDSSHTHFIYLEDDIRFCYRNFSYFVRSRPLLAEKGLIPSLVRTELNHHDYKLYATDARIPLFESTGGASETGEDFLFIDPPNPYCAVFILDRELAEEYVATRSFDKETSKEVSNWNVRERAAMGLCWENPPRGFRSRYAIPLVPKTGMIAGDCWVVHISGNYANDPGTKHGKTPMNQLR